MPNEYDMDQMREDAVRRAREMQSRAHLPPRQEAPQRRGSQQRSPAQRSSSPSQPAQRHPPEPPAEHTESPTEHTQLPGTHQPMEERSQGQMQSPGLLESLFQDKERTVILALLILLSEDDSHHDLMFALMFLLM